MTETRPVTSRAEWLTWRQRYLGASEIGAAFGLDEYKSPLRLWAEKRGMVPDQPETSVMRRGLLFEAAAIEYLKFAHPDWTIERPGLFWFDDETRLSCTPDALVKVDGEHVNVQIKTISLPRFERWDGRPPMNYQLQVVQENLLTGADRGILAVLVVSAHDAFLEEFAIPRHQAMERHIVAAAKEFWAAVDEARPPAADYRRDADTIASLFPPDPDAPVPLDLSGDNRIGAILLKRERMKYLQKAAKERCEALDAELVEKLNGAELALAPGWKITRKMRHRPEHVVKAVDYPALDVRRLKEEHA